MSTEPCVESAPIAINLSRSNTSTMSNMWKQLRDENHRVLYRQASGAHIIEVTDEFLTPMVVVHGQKDKSASEFSLESIGAFYADEVNKFFDLGTSEEIVPGDLNDRALTEHLGMATGAKKEGNPWGPCPDCGRHGKSCTCEDEAVPKEKEDKADSPAKKEAEIPSKRKYNLCDYKDDEGKKCEAHLAR